MYYNDHGYSKAAAEYERELYDPYADEMTEEEYEERQDYIGNMQYDDWHERQAEIDEATLWGF